MPPVSRASLALFGAAAVLAGCAGGTPDPTVVRDGALHLRLDEYRVEPGALNLRAGRIRIDAVNRGRLTHNVEVQQAVDEEAAIPVALARTATIQPGERAPVVEVRLAPGRYRLVCTIGNHENLGQYAVLEVTRAAA